VFGRNLPILGCMGDPGRHSSTYGLLGVAFAPVILAFASIAHAEWRVSVYGGASYTFDSDVKLKQPGGTDLTLHDVPWSDESFKSPIYYGARLGYWFNDSPWGLALDFTHAKMIANSGDVVEVSGSRAGVPVSGQEPVGNTFSNLQISHGLNLLTLNGLYRLRPPIGIEPYAGLGLGVAIPHIETRTGTVETQGYELAGPAAQALIGIDAPVYKGVSAFVEYKLTYARISGDLEGGGTLDVNPWTNHFVFGLSYRFF
jgi:lipid A oxidase